MASFPDGSPTLADYRKADGSFGTAALIGSGAGGKSLLALDVTATVSSSGAVVGPTPLWTTVPGEADAGQAYAKPAVARVLIGGAEKFIAIAATGIANENPTAPFTKGRVVAAYEVRTGRLLWKFQAQCAVTSDVATFETDDDLEPNAPSLQRLRRPRGVRRRLRLRLQARPGPRPGRRLERQHRPGRAGDRRRHHLAPRRQHHHDRSVRAVLDPPHQRTRWAPTARSPARWRSARTPAPAWCCSSAPAASRATR
jgi:hypothetical protein